MKKICTILGLLLALAATAQQTEGVIRFEEKMNLHRNLPPEAAQERAMIPEYQVHPSELLFSATESLYHNLEEDADDEDPGQGGVVMRIQRPESIFYRDFVGGRRIDFREFMGKNYLIQDSLTAPGWKLTGESKTILGYSCGSATMQDTVRRRQITAWFTDAIAVPAGPSSFGQLPGMILEVDINAGEIVVTATKVEFRKLKKNELVAPKKGEKISNDDFQKMVAAQMRENGGRPMRIIRN